jgi:hypothetical protein
MGPEMSIFNGKLALVGAKFKGNGPENERAFH